MIYEKQNWENAPSKKTPINRYRLQHIEDGIEAVDNNIPTVGNLNTDNSSKLDVSSSESMKNNINLHKVAKTGSYNDLNDKPEIPTNLDGYVQTTGNQNIKGVKTFDTTPKCSNLPTDSSDLVNKKYVDEHEDYIVVGQYDDSKD